MPISMDASISVRPKVLLATTSRWYPTARLAMALSKAGCTVDAVCPVGHPLHKTTAVRQTFPYRGLAPLRSVERAITAAEPDLVVPGDDLATRYLQSLYQRLRGQGNEANQICTVIERSLGAPDSFPIEYARAAFMEVAREEGIRVPRTQVVASREDLSKCIAEIGFPFVLKANGTSGGYGVRIVHTPEEARRAFRTLHAPPLWARAAKRAIVNHDVTLVWPALIRRNPVVNAQLYVPGREATTAVACWQGTILAALHFEVIKKRNATGPATVIRLIDNIEMSATAEKLVRRLNLSGLHGFDYMLEATNGNAHLIEMNPRATQVGHLTFGPGRDIPAALRAILSGEPVQAAPRVTDLDTIALFPQEWIRDPDSEYLQLSYHDVPWDEPEFVRDCVGSHRKQSAWYAKQVSVQVSSSDLLASQNRASAGM